jgi:hypothetical protein
MNDDNKIKTPTDPSDDFEEMINDRSGLTGITTNDDSINRNATDNDISNVNTSSDFRYKKNEEQGFTTDNPTPQNNNNRNSDFETKMPDISNQNETLDESETPAVKGEQSVSGDMPDPSTDDDALNNAHDMGIALEEDPENPKELDIGSDIDEAEEYQKTH